MMAEPTPRQVQDFDAEINIGDQFRNKYREHDNPPASRIIQISEKLHGNTVQYWVVERHRLRNREGDSVTFTMSTRNLLERYERLPHMEGEAPTA